MKILFWQIFLIVFAVLVVLFVIKIIKKMKMKNKLKITILFLTIISYSCSDNNLVLQEEKLTKEKIIQHLKKRNNNYTFHDDSTFFLNKKETKLPEPIYFDNIEEMDDFLNKMESLSNQTASSVYLTHAPPNDGGAGDNEGYFTKKAYIGGFGVYMNVGFNFVGCSGSNLNSWISIWIYTRCFLASQRRDFINRVSK